MRNAGLIQEPLCGVVETVTPALAAEWLEKKTPNRRIEPNLVLAMARDMVAGRWQITHQGLAFDSHGLLIDGQHRLSAVIIADRPVDMMVTRGLPREARLVIDDHRKRSGADVLSIQTGKAVEFTVVAILNFMESTVGHTRYSKAELADAYERYGAAARFTMAEVKQHVRGITTAPALAPVARAYFGQDRERLKEFVHVLATGIPKHTPADNAALRLREWLLSHREDRRKPARADIFDRAQAALRLFLDRSDVRTLRPATKDLFPVPDHLRSARSVQKLKAVK